MKKLFLMALISVASCQLAIGADLRTGAWELISAKYTDLNGKLVDEIKDQNVLSLKILSKTHFSFIKQSKEGKFISAGGGRYYIVDDKYIESVSYASNPKMIGKDYHFTYQIKNGDWIHTGLEDGVHIEEIWHRVK